MDIAVTDTVVRRADVLSTTVDGCVVLLDSDRQVFVGFDDIGTHIWQAIDKPVAVADLCVTLSTRYAAERPVSAALILFCGLAFATDMPVKAAPMIAPVGAYNWAGWYAGGNIGYGWSANTDANASAADGNDFGFLDPGHGAGYFTPGVNITPNVLPKGVIGGAQVGYNWMISPNWVAGIVTDFQASGMKASVANSLIPSSGFLLGTQTNSVQTDWFGTARGKFGFAENDILFYATGGLAYGHVQTSGQFTNAVNGGTTFVGSSSPTKTGWAIGGGIDYGFAARWSIGAEYLYVNLGHLSYTETTATQSSTTATINNRAAASIVRATLNYKF